MPKLSSRSKHEEFESNSVLHIRDQKERRAENARKEEQKVEEKREAVEFCRIVKFSQPAEFRSLRNFAGCEFSQLANFRRLHCSSCEISFLLPLFDFLTHFVPFLVLFPFYPL